MFFGLPIFIAKTVLKTTCRPTVRIKDQASILAKIMHETAPLVINVTSKQRLPPAARAYLHKHKHLHEFDSCSVTHSKKRQGATFSDHAMQRAQQRRITRAHVDECRAHGVAEFEQGFKGVRILHRLHGLCVVSCAKTGHVITQWWEGQTPAEAELGQQQAQLGRHAHVRALRSQEKEAYHHGPRMR